MAPKGTLQGKEQKRGGPSLHRLPHKIYIAFDSCRRLPPALATSIQLTTRGQLPYLGHSHYKTKTFKHLVLF